MGLPWCGIKNPPSKAGDVGLIPGLGTKIPYAVKQLRPCAAAARETHMSQKKEPVHHREIPHAEMKIQYSQKKKKKKNPASAIQLLCDLGQVSEPQFFLWG